MGSLPTRATPLFAVVARAAEQFLRAPYDDAAVAEMLSQLGQAAAASRAYLFVEREESPGVKVTDLRLEWVARGISPQVSNPALERWSFHEAWTEPLRKRLQRGETIVGTPIEFPDPLRSMLIEQQVQSILVAPVHVHGVLWGFLGFDESRMQRDWNESEAMALRLGASVLAAAIEREQAESELRASEASHRDLVESAPDVIWSMDLGGRFLRVNAAFEALFERPRSEIVGRSWRELIPVDQHGEVERAVRSAHDNGVPETAYELRVDRPSGGSAWLEVRSRIMERDRVRVGYQGTGRDISERRRIEERLRQAVRMEAWGRLAAALARDFDSLMVSIRGFCESTLARIREDDPLRAEISEILLAAERATELTRELLAFGRQQPARPVGVELAEMLEQRMPLLRRIVGEEIAVVNLVEAPVGRILVDPDLIEQALVALFLAARDSMDDAGRIEMAATVVTPAELLERGAPEAPAPAYLRLSIRDTGPGFSSEDAERLFEPFYSTEELGQGRGLGLSTVYGIVRQCEGFVFASGHPGEGNIFDLYLPRLEPLAATGEEAPLRVGVAGSATILLVEDEDLIRSLAEQILTECGYTVLSASNAGEALDIAGRLEGGIDLLLTDIVMPGVSGSDLAQRLERQHPTMKVLYMSGYSDSLIFRYGVLQERAAFLQKPFSAEILERKVGELVGSARGDDPGAGSG